jgi:hypothetical protein
MSSSNSLFPKDELDCLVQGALEARVSGQEPPRRVWKRIQRELKTGEQRTPRRFRSSWPYVALQAALTLLLMLMGSVGLQTLLNTASFEDNAAEELRPSVTIAYVDECTSSTDSLPISEESDVRLLRSLSRLSHERQSTSDATSAPPVIVPPDLPPRALIQEVRAHQVDLSHFGPPPEQQNQLQGGPYEWFR